MKCFSFNEEAFYRPYIIIIFIHDTFLCLQTQDAVFRKTLYANTSIFMKCEWPSHGERPLVHVWPQKTEVLVLHQWL